MSSSLGPRSRAPGTSSMDYEWQSGHSITNDQRELTTTGARTIPPDHLLVGVAASTATVRIVEEKHTTSLEGVPDLLILTKGRPTFCSCDTHIAHNAGAGL